MPELILKRWTADDIAMLKSMAQKYPTKQIAAQLGRMPSAVIYKAHKLNISLRVRDKAALPTIEPAGTELRD